MPIYTLNIYYNCLLHDNIEYSLGEATYEEIEAVDD